MFLRKKGFTLIELVVVITIIAVLIAIFLPYLATARARSKYTACVSNVKNIGTALESYHAQRKAYPTEEEFLSLYSSGLDGFINYVPVCPSSEGRYVYKLDAENKHYKIICRPGLRAHIILNIGDGYPQFSSTGELLMKETK